MIVMWSKFSNFSSLPLLWPRPSLQLPGHLGQLPENSLSQSEGPDQDKVLCQFTFLLYPSLSSPGSLTGLELHPFSSLTWSREGAFAELNIALRISPVHGLLAINLICH
ncbi:hypothetical protein UPYG_G00029590 [Umbra pygmaea]|uniref:Uncharacterized protein n=1 Tax=Umbra pygmaea TaxID=75934 RepID=A0ABD0XMG0_UMBPY